MTDKDWLDKVSMGLKVYNENLLHRDFQSAEIEKFVQWLYEQYGVVYHGKS